MNRYVELGNDSRHVQVFWPFAASVTLCNLPLEIGEPIGWNGDNCFGGQASVGIIVGGKVIAGIFGFALSPNLFRAIGIILIGQNKIEALFRLAFILDLDVEFVAGFCGTRQGNIELCIGGVEFRSGFIHGDGLNLQADGIEGRSFRGSA